MGLVIYKGHGRAAGRRACSIFLFLTFFATTGSKPCSCRVLEGGVRRVMLKMTLSGMCQASGVGDGQWQQLACAVFPLTAATGSVFEVGSFFAAVSFFVASCTPCP